jgi:hypothetical protein
MDIVKCNYQESREIILNNILKLLQNGGHLINMNGWAELLNIIQQLTLNPSILNF